MFFGRQTHRKGKQKSNNQYYFFSWKAIIIERKWHVKEKQVPSQWYKYKFIDLLSWSPTLMNTQKKKKKDLHVNHPSKNPILKKKKIKTLGFKNYKDLPRIRWTKHIKVKENQNLKLTKLGTHPIKRNERIKHQKSKRWFTTIESKLCVSFFLGLLAQSKPRWFSIHYLKHIAL